MGDYWIPKREDVVTRVEREMIAGAMAHGFNVIVDATNLNPKTLKSLGAFIEKQENASSYATSVKEFYVDFNEALKRDTVRGENGGRAVGKKVLKSFYHRYYPDFRKKVDERNYVEYDPSLPDCIISDIDGTISLMNGRDPFIGEDCATDLPNKPVIDILKMYEKLNFHTETESTEIKIILFSGRNGSSQPQTEQWLQGNNVPYDEIYMREVGNYEKDTLLKERFYNTHIKGKYNVKFILDDRDCVVKKWRELGLPCFQVYMGDF